MWVTMNILALLSAPLECQILVLTSSSERGFSHLDSPPGDAERTRKCYRNEVLEKVGCRALVTMAFKNRKPVQKRDNISLFISISPEYSGISGT